MSNKPMRMAIDMASLLKTCLRAGKDPMGVEMDIEGRKFQVNTWEYGLDNFINAIVKALDDFNLVPMDLVLVQEGRNAKARRLMIYKDYKGTRAEPPPEFYEQYQKLREEAEKTLRNLGACVVTQDHVEGDDVLAWLAKHTRQDLVVVSNDGDMAVLEGVNEHGANIMTRINGEVGVNKCGEFPHKFITLYKALVGDTTDNIKGARGFGEKAWMVLLATYGEDGLQELDTMLRQQDLTELEQLAQDNNCKVLSKIFEERENVITSYRVAQLHPEWVNTMKHIPQWKAGIVLPTKDERLQRWGAVTRLVTANNFDKALEGMQRNLDVSPFFAIDLETTVPDESDDWLEGQGKAEGKGVDVIASIITGGSITFGRNMQYSLYFSVKHTDTANITPQQFAKALEMVAATGKLIAAHNAQGFELPVLFNAFGEAWANNGWRGFMPNMVDTRILASHWNENAHSHGLKQLSSELQSYTQTTYDEVTQGRKMHELTGREVLEYGVDDTITCAGIKQFFHLILELEGTWDAVMAVEQKPMYLQAMSFVKGLPVDMARLTLLARNDEEARIKHEEVLNKALIEYGWDGVHPPEIKEINPALVKLAYLLITSSPLETAVRTPAKLAVLVREARDAAADELHPDLSELAMIVEEGLVGDFRNLIRRHWKGLPVFNPGSPLQLQNLMYTVMGLPIRLRNKPTDKMRADGKKEGTPRTDEDAINMAIKMGDTTPEQAQVLKSLLELKSITTRNGLYWSAWPTFLHWKTGKIHPSLRQSGTNTRRYSASSPNIQQMDSSADGVRSCVLPHKRNAVVLSLDFQAQEVRQMTDYSLDANLMACFIGDSKKDVHSLVGHRVAGVTYEEFMAMRKNPATADEAAAVRQIAKTVFFAVAYGAVAKKIAETLGITEEEAQKYLDNLDEAFPGLTQWKADTEEQAKAEGFVKLSAGPAGYTIRHLRELLLSENKYDAAKAARQSVNARIQGAGGNQIKLVMAAIWDSDIPDKYDYQWYFSAHDETVHSVAAEHALPCSLELHALMTQKFLNAVPSMSSLGLGKNYGQLIELSEVFTQQDILEALHTLGFPVDGVCAA